MGGLIEAARDAARSTRDRFQRGVLEYFFRLAPCEPQMVQQVIKRLRDWGAELVQESSGKSENVTFPLPKVLRSGS